MRVELMHIYMALPLMPQQQPCLLALLVTIGLLGRTSSEPSGLTLSVYKNTAADGAPAASSVIAGPAAAFPDQSGPFSAEITGTLVADAADAAKTASTATSKYTFACDFTAATLA